MVWHAGEDEVPVGLVEDESDIVFPGEQCEGREQAARIYRTSLDVLRQRMGAERNVRTLTGLFGLHKTIALVFGVISLAQRSGEGKKPSFASVCNKIGFMPSIVRVILSGEHVSDIYSAGSQ